MMNALDVQLHARFALSRLNVSIGALLGMNSSCYSVEPSTRLCVVARVFAVVADLFVKLVVLVLRDVFLWRVSQRSYLSSRFPIRL
jgi:hypothetical protein